MICELVEWMFSFIFEYKIMVDFERRRMGLD